MLPQDTSLKQNINYNTQTHKKKEEFNECLISFKDMPLNILSHYSSSPNIRNKNLILFEPQKQPTQNHFKYSEAEINFDHLIEDEVRIYDEDGLLTNFRLDQSDLSFEDVPIISKFRRGKTITGNANIDKYKNNCQKSPIITTNKLGSSRSLDSSPFRVDKSSKKNLNKTQNENLKIKNIGRFINKPLRYSGNNEFNSGYMICCLKKSSPKKKGIHGRNRSAENIIISPSVSSTQELIGNNTNSFSRTTVKIKSYIDDKKVKNKKKNFFKFTNSSNNNKNSDKIVNELFSVFGKKLNNVDSVYQNLSEDDKRCLIYQLLGIVCSLKKDIQNQIKENDNMKKEAELKSKLISSLAKEIEKTKRQIELNKSSIKGNNNKNEKDKISYSNKHNKSSSTVKKGNKSIDKIKRK